VTKTKVIILVSFALVFAAGAAVGMLMERSGHRPPRRPGPFGGFSGLDLTPEQQEEVRLIWSEREEAEGPSMFERARQLEEEKRNAIIALMTEEQQVRYEEILQEHERKLNELSQERRKEFERKVELTKEILTEPQRKKFEELIEEGRNRGRELLPGHPGTPRYRRPGGPSEERQPS